MDIETTLNALASFYGAPPVFRWSLAEAARAGKDILGYYKKHNKLPEVMGFIRGFNKQPSPVSAYSRIHAFFNEEHRLLLRRIDEGYEDGRMARRFYFKDDFR